MDPPSANALTGFFQHSFLEDLVRLQHAWILFVKRVLLLANAVMILDAPNFWISFISALLHIFQKQSDLVGFYRSLQQLPRHQEPAQWTEDKGGGDAPPRTLEGTASRDTNVSSYAQAMTQPPQRVCGS